MSASCRPWDQRGDALSYVISKDLSRRHLSDSQRAMVGAKIANLRLGYNASAHRGDCECAICRKAQIGGLPAPPPISQATSAKMMNVGERYVANARSSQRRAPSSARGNLSDLAASVRFGRYGGICRLLTGLASHHADGDENIEVACMSSQPTTLATNVVHIADQLLERAAAEGFISSEFGIPVEVIRLDRAAQAGNGPPFRCWGRKPLYRKADLISWATRRLTKPMVRSGNYDQQSAS
jgi:hypothetical protein